MSVVQLDSNEDQTFVIEKDKWFLRVRSNVFNTKDANSFILEFCTSPEGKAMKLPSYIQLYVQDRWYGDHTFNKHDQSSFSFHLQATDTFQVRMNDLVVLELSPSININVEPIDEGDKANKKIKTTTT